jgi:hypothetical protein
VWSNIDAHFLVSNHKPVLTGLQAQWWMHQCFIQVKTHHFVCWIEPGCYIVDDCWQYDVLV